MTERTEAWTTPVRMAPVGVVRDGRESSDDDYWGGIRSTIELDPGRFDESAMFELESRTSS